MKVLWFGGPLKGLFGAASLKNGWSAQITAANVTDETALYNFLSTFSGTHYVTPRAVTAQIGFNF